jgi:hypothetical protein
MRFLCDYLGRLGALLVLPEKNEYEPRADISGPLAGVR